ELASRADPLEHDVSAPVLVCAIEPGSKGALCQMLRLRPRIEDEAQTEPVQAPRKLDVLRPLEVGIETADCLHVVEPHRGVAGVELTWRRSPIARLHGAVLLL